MHAPRTSRIREEKPRRPVPAGDIAYPLDALYARAGVPGPVIRATTADGIPQPYQRLLAHENEMTSTLEHHFGGSVTVRVLSSYTSGRSYFRRSLLAIEATAVPIAMGAVRLRLDAFRPAVRAHILRGAVPLGRILRDAGIDYHSRPWAFLEVLPNAEMMGVFRMAEPRTLYGRRTRVTLDAARIGDIVEVLPLV